MMDSLPVLRQMRLHDVRAVSEVEHDAFDHGWAPSSFERELTGNGAARYLVLEGVDQRILGFGGIWLMVDEAHVVTVAVARDLQRTGLGRVLVDGLLRLAWSLGMVNATLECRVSNVAARALYRDYGFYEVGERKKYYADNNEDAVIMTTEAFAQSEYVQRLERLRAKLPPFVDATVGIS